MKSIAVLASGDGTNAENIICYFEKSNTARVNLLIYNRKEAGVAKRAERLGVSAVYISKDDFADHTKVLNRLKEYNIELIILAGFLLLVPEYLLQAFPHRILNIHPALLPLHSGRGMYGIRVHEDVIASGEKETGITIHFIDANFDQGEVLFQITCPVFPQDTAADVAQRVHQLEYKYYPQVIEAFSKTLNR